MLLHLTFYPSLQKKECGKYMDSDEHSDNEVQEPEQQHEDFYWNTVPGGVYQKDLEETYNQIV